MALPRTIELPRLSILVPVFNGAHFLDDAVGTVLAQSFRDWELLLFDDGSTDSSREICQRYAATDPRIRCSSHPKRANRGQFATRVAAANAAESELVALLDQDDLWDPLYLEKHLRIWNEVERSNVQLSYGPGAYWHPNAPERDYVQPMPPTAPRVFQPPELLASFFERHYAATPLPSCTLLRRDALRAVERFSELARGSQCEDQYLSWFVASRWPIAIHSEAWVRYRQHDASALARMLSAPKSAKRAERRFLEVAQKELRQLHPSHPLLRSGRLEERLRELGAGQSARQRLVTRLGRAAPRPQGMVGALRQAWSVGRTLGARSRLAYGVLPLSEAFGEDRGVPITRHYVGQFLAEHTADVRGRCLEFEGADYTRRYGGAAVEHSDVLHLDASNPAATIVADLTAENDIPSERYDCIIATFVLHEIFDLDAAVRELHRILKPGGTLLIAVPHVTMCEPKYNELWRFTVQGITELLAETFGADGTTIRAYGNSLTAAGQIRGLVAHEFSDRELEVHDPRFAVVICARVTKEGRAPTPSLTPRSAKPEHGSQALILLYHRVAAPPQDAHLLCVPPPRFREHLDVVCQLARPLSLGELTQRMEAGTLPPRAITITFDDGYADNLLSAKPELERYGVPATVFVTSGYVGAQREFWWDQVERLFLETPELPSELYVELVGTRRTLSLGGAARWTEADIARYRGWNVLDAETPTERHHAFRQALEELRPLPDLVRRRALARLFVQASAPSKPRPSHRALDPGELRALADGSLVEVGAHSVTHAKLSALAPDDQRVEIAASKARLEDLIGRPVTSFAYPFGSPADYTRDTVAIVREEGFRAACSNFPGVVTTGSAPFELPRIMMMNWPPHELARRLEEMFAQPQRLADSSKAGW